MAKTVEDRTPQGGFQADVHQRSQGDPGVIATASSTKARLTSSTKRPQHGDREHSDNHTRVGTESPPTKDLEKGQGRGAAFLNRFRGKGRRRIPTWSESLKVILLSSWMNVLFVFVPLSWISHFHKWGPKATFSLSIIAIVPLEKMFDYLGEELALYCGRSLGDLIIITLNNTVEATLAIILLNKCELRLVQSTIIGVILLHLLLVPGFAFLTGGAKVSQQHLHEHPVQLNHVLLTFGVLCLLVPTAFFAALNSEPLPADAAEKIRLTTPTGAVIDLSQYPAVSDEVRGVFLRISRGLACIMMLIYVASRVYLHNPPGDNNALKPQSDERKEEEETEEEEPEVNPWACILFIAITVGLMAATAEWLVYSFEYIVSEKRKITKEWLGLILLPLVSFSGDGLVTVAFWVKTILGLSPPPPHQLAKGRAIDLSIQFSLFWMPLFVLIAWWIHKPLSLLFDIFEVTIVIAGCFLVNYVTQDAKTNWIEGLTMVVFYVGIALAAWFYPGQSSHSNMLACLTSVSQAVSSGAIVGGDHKA